MGRRDGLAAVMLIGGLVFAAYGAFVLLVAGLNALGIAFTGESMAGLGFVVGPLALIAGVVPIAAGMAVLRRAEPARRIAGLTAVLYAPLAAWFGLNGLGLFRSAGMEVLLDAGALLVAAVSLAIVVAGASVAMNRSSGA